MKNIKIIVNVIGAMLILSACGVPKNLPTATVQHLPEQYSQTSDSSSSGKILWSTYFNDPYLNTLIDEALHRNQELAVMQQEISIAQNEVKAKKGRSYLMFN